MTELGGSRYHDGMGMRETPRSLRLYFIIFGVLGALAGISTLARIKSFGLDAVLMALGSVFSAAFVVAGARLKRDLVHGARWILGVLLANGVLIAVNLVRSLIAGPAGPAMGIGVFGLLIVWYLYRSVSRLAREAREEAVDRFTKAFE